MSQTKTALCRGMHYFWRTQVNGKSGSKPCFRRSVQRRRRSQLLINIQSIASPQCRHRRWNTLSKSSQGRSVVFAAQQYVSAQCTVARHELILRTPSAHDWCMARCSVWSCAHTLYICMKKLSEYVFSTTIHSNMYIVGKIRISVREHARHYDSVVTLVMIFLKRNSETQVMYLEKCMYDISEIFHRNRLYDVLINWRGNVARFTILSGLSRSEWKIHLNIDCRDNYVVAEKSVWWTIFVHRFIPP